MNRTEKKAIFRSSVYIHIIIGSPLRTKVPIVQTEKIDGFLIEHTLKYRKVAKKSRQYFSWSILYPGNTTLFSKNWTMCLGSQGIQGRWNRWGNGNICYPHNLADQVTLFQPGQTDNDYHVTKGGFLSESGNRFSYLPKNIPNFYLELSWIWNLKMYYYELLQNGYISDSSISK